VDGEPQDLALGDLDGDLDLDVAVAAMSPGKLSFLINRGDGTFADQAVFSVQESPGTAVIADLDGDLDADLAVANQTSSTVTLLFNRSSPPASQDADRNGIPDECEGGGRFHRGDTDGDGRTDITDAVFLLVFAFLGGEAPGCLDSADVDGSGVIDITDAVFLLAFHFLGGPAPPTPGPPPLPCGPDPDPPGSPGNLGCRSYPPCN
jgi:hypothetical protein